MATNHQAVTMMQIGEVAKHASLTVDAIRFYEKRKLLPKAVRSAGRFRLYGQGTIERLHALRLFASTVKMSNLSRRAYPGLPTSWRYGGSHRRSAT